MAQDSDNETMVFRRFDELTAHNLLYLQCELFDLEERLREMNAAVLAGYDMDQKDAAREWEVLLLHETGRHMRPEVVQAAKERMALIREVRAKLKEYHEALLLHSQIVNLHRPNQRVLGALRTWLYQPFPLLGGKARRFLEHKTDLVALKEAVNGDYLSSFLRRHWAHFAQKEPSRDGRSQIARFEERTIILTVNIVTILVSAIFLIGSIVALRFSESDPLKLGIIALFTVGFAASVSLVTNARRAEIFAATAAYAAVLVVFVSSDLSGTSSQTCQPCTAQQSLVPATA
ncbi:hypothetical protein F5Y19DRAFT_462826 [Xylariaceae sp. FL1651]|nr:hypothetical protein F5Y19DRAFT_462826 [Xylariaceae sp. FL1651]